MVSILIVHATKEARNCALEINSEKLPNIEACWYAVGKKEGVRMIQTYRPTLVILDVNLEAGLDFEVFELTKAIPYQKIIICDTDSYALKVMRFDIDDYLVKPLGSEELEHSIEKLLFRQKKYKIQQLYKSRTLKTIATLSTAFVECHSGTKILNLADIVRIQDMGAHRLLSMADEQMLSSEWPLDRFIDLVAGSSFVRISEEQLINSRQIKDLQHQGERLYARMSDGHNLRLPLRLEQSILQRNPEDEAHSSAQYPAEGWQ